MTPIEFAETIAVLETGVGREMPPGQAKVWFEVLGDLTVIQLRTAVVRALREHKFAGFPPVGVLRDFAGCGAPAAIPAQDRAVVAWDCVTRAMRDHGGYQTVQFDDPAVTAAVRSVGGWEYLTGLETDELTRFVRPRFLEAYRAHFAAGVPALAAEPLAGILAADAGRDGYAAPEAVLVETNLPGDVRVIGERRVRIDSDPVKRLTDALPCVSELCEPTDSKPEPKPLPSVEEQRAALVAKYGL